MSSAIGSSSSALKSPHGDYWVDVRDFGAKGDGGITDNTGPIQAAVDALAAKLRNAPSGPQSPIGVVYVPSATGTYQVNRPIWVDSNNIEIRGDGWGSQVGLPPSLKHSVFIFGVRRVDSANVNGTTVPLQIDSTYRPDLFGKLDSTVISAPGQRWGVRTNNNAFVQIQASPLSSGVQYAPGPNNYWDNWTQTTKLTIEFCLEPPDGQSFPPNAPLLGIGVMGVQPSPFVVGTWNDPNTILVNFKTADFDPGQNQGCRSFAFSVAGAQRPYRIAIQFDLDNAACSAFVNGTQVGFSYIDQLSTASPHAFAPNSGLRFQQNDYYPLMIGTSDVRGNFGAPTGVDLRLYGLRFSNVIRYSNNGTGVPQQRADSPATAVTDAYAYFTNDNNTIGYLTMADNPATSGRLVTIQHGNTVNGGVGSGLFLNSLNLTPCSGNAVRDLAIYAGFGHGQAVAVGAVLEMTFENFKSLNGFHAIGSLNIEANYNIYLRNCFLFGTDAAYYGFVQIIDASDVYCLNSGRATVRLVGCNGSWHKVFISFAAPNAESYFKLHSFPTGGNHYITNLQADFEGYTLTLAAIYCEAHALSPATSLVLKDIYLGTIGAGAALVMLKDMGTSNPFLNRCWLSVENLQASTNTYLAAVDVDGPLWHGEVKGVALNGPQFNHRGRWGSTTKVAIRDTKFAGPPRQFLWFSGAHVLEVRSPVDGQFAEWRCMTTGTNGTPAPPKWVGINPLQLTTNGLAAYVVNHAYVTVNLN